MKNVFWCLDGFNHGQLLLSYRFNCSDGFYKAHVARNAKGSLGVKEERKVKSLCIIWHNMSIGKGMKRVT